MPPKPELASPSLLSPAAYDDDASVRSPSEQDSDSEDDAYVSRTRTSQELAQHDRAVLEDEDELEKLLTRSGPASGLRRIFSPNGSSVRIGKRRGRGNDNKRRRRRGGGEERDGLMDGVEEGFRDDSSSVLSPAEDEDGGGFLEKDGYGHGYGYGYGQVCWFFAHGRKKDADLCSRREFRGGGYYWHSRRCWCCF